MKDLIKWCDELEEKLFRCKVCLFLTVWLCLATLWAFAWLAKALIQCY